MRVISSGSQSVSYCERLSRSSLTNQPLVGCFWRPKAFRVGTGSCRRVAELARQILDGEIDVLDMSLKIAALRSEVEVEDWDQDFMACRLVSSETDHLPIGSEALN